MKPFNSLVSNLPELRSFLTRSPLMDAARSASGILVQVFVGDGNDMWIGDVVQLVHEALPDAVIVGATSAGEICDGNVAQGGTLLSVLCFQSTQLSCVGQACGTGQEFASGQAIGMAFHHSSDLRAVLLLAPPTRLHCAQILAGLQSVLPDTLVFGGGAADSEQGGGPRVFLGGEIYELGCVAVALAGADLHVEQHIFSGWKALGPGMTLTDVRGFELRSIDGRPAVEMYRKYLHIEPDDQDIFLLEFPLLIDRDGVQIARNPVSMHDDGSVGLVADVSCGEKAHLAYLDIDSAQAQTQAALAALGRSGAEAILIYSCVCRRFTLQRDVDFETRPFQELAPVSGFFTYGEFCRLGKQLQILNSSEVVVAMREHGASPAVRVANEWTRRDADNYSFRHSRITSRLFALVTTLTEELEQANCQLKFLAEHDSLTGALNRHSMDGNLQMEWRRSHRYGYSFSVLMLDLDNFKHFNDEHGHAVGDLILERLGSVVRTCIRACDSFYRFGGEEFLVLLPEAPMGGALEVADKIRTAVEAMCDKGEVILPPATCSLGVASYPEDGDDLQAILRNADRALYRAKAEGRNRVARSPFSAVGEAGAS